MHSRRFVWKNDRSLAVHACLDTRIEKTCQLLHRRCIFPSGTITWWCRRCIAEASPKYSRTFLAALRCPLMSIGSASRMQICLMGPKHNVTGIWRHKVRQMLLFVISSDQNIVTLWYIVCANEGFAAIVQQTARFLPTYYMCCVSLSCQFIMTNHKMSYLLKTMFYCMILIISRRFR